MTQYAIAWAAGFIDGEGCIQIVKNKDSKSARGHYYTLRLTVAQVEPRPLEILAELFGGTIHQRKSRNSYRAFYWEWTISTGRACEALERMLPYLVVKRKQAQIAIRFAKRRQERVPQNVHGHFVALTSRQFQQDERDFDQIRLVRG